MKIDMRIIKGNEEICLTNLRIKKYTREIKKFETKEDFIDRYSNGFEIFGRYNINEKCPDMNEINKLAEWSMEDPNYKSSYRKAEFFLQYDSGKFIDSLTFSRAFATQYSENSNFESGIIEYHVVIKQFIDEHYLLPPAIMRINVKLVKEKETIDVPAIKVLTIENSNNPYIYNSQYLLDVEYLFDVVRRFGKTYFNQGLEDIFEIAKIFYCTCFDRDKECVFISDLSGEGFKIDKPIEVNAFIKKMKLIHKWIKYDEKNETIFNFPFKYEWRVREGEYKNEVTNEFLLKVIKISFELGVDHEDLMAVMAFQSKLIPTYAPGGFFGPVGLIQFNCDDIGVTRVQVLKMPAITQLDYVQKYLQGVKDQYNIPLNSLRNLFLAVLYPSAFNDTNKNREILWYRGDPDYAVNEELDLNADGKITKQEAVQNVINNRNAHYKGMPYQL